MYTFTKEFNARNNIDVFKIQESTSNKTIYLNSKVSPWKEIEKFGKQLDHNKCYFIIGSGNGVLLQYLMKMNFRSKFYVFEVFSEIQYDEDYKRKLLEYQVQFNHATDLNYLDIYNAIIESFGMDTEILIHPNYEKLNQELIKPTLNLIKMGTVSAEIYRNTEKRFQFEWLTEPILNLSLTSNGNSLLDIKKHFQNKPFILVASGPSLTDNLDFIEKNKDNAYIIASGSAVNGLINYNITPDFVTVFDASMINYTAHFQNTKYTGPIISAGTTNHLILKNHKGEIFFTNIGIDSITQEVRSDFLKVPTVPSVAVYSLLLSHFLGANEVYLVGQDLALQYGEYYAKGVHNHEGTKKLGPTIEVEGNLGKIVNTTYNLSMMLEMFNDAVATIHEINGDLKIYNLSKIGAKIAGVPYIEKETIVLEESIDKSWINRSSYINILDYKISLSYIKKLKECKIEVDYIVKKMYQLNVNAVTLKDLETLLKLIKKLRSNEILETHILSRLSTKTKIINNFFEYGFEHNFQTNEERIEVLQKLKLYVNDVQEYLKELFNNEAWTEIDENI